MHFPENRNDWGWCRVFGERLMNIIQSKKISDDRVGVGVSKNTLPTRQRRRGEGWEGRGN